MSDSRGHPQTFERDDGQPSDARPDHDDVAARGQLLPEERAVGTDDAEAQAEAVLAESVERTEAVTGITDREDHDATVNPQSAHRRSEDTA